MVEDTLGQARCSVVKNIILPEDLSLSPSTHVGWLTPLSISFRCCNNTLSLFHWLRHTGDTHTNWKKIYKFNLGFQFEHPLWANMRLFPGSEWRACNNWRITGWVLNKKRCLLPLQLFCPTFFLNFLFYMYACLLSCMSVYHMCA